MLRAEIARIIASRYLLSKKSHSIINLVSIVTIVSIAIPTAAMIILLSVHNGFEDFIGRLWSTIDAPLVVESVEGKYFKQGEIPVERINNIDGVKNVSYYIEDNALLRYKERQSVATVRGVDSIYNTITGIEYIVSQGKYDLSQGSLLGMGMAYQLGLKVNLSEDFTALAPSSISYDPFNPSSVYNTIKLHLGGIFSLDAERDAEIVFVSLPQAQQLFSRKDEATALAISVKDGYDVQRVKRDISIIVGDKYKVKDIEEQNVAEYKLIKSEKVAIYLIILLVMIIASFTLIGTIIMLIIEKRESMFSFRVMGLVGEDIRAIFMWQGFFISLVGALSGIILGLLVTLSQQEWGFVPINGASLLLDSYPVKVIFGDAVIVLLSVVIVTFSISLITNKIMIKY